MSYSRRSTLLLTGLGIVAAGTALFWDRRADEEYVPFAPVQAASSAQDTNTSTASVRSVERQVPSPLAAASSTPGSPDKSEGGVDIGQTMLFAIHGGTTRQAARAAEILQSCQSIQGLGESVRRLKPTAKISAEKLTQIAAATDEQERRCQSITQDMQSHLPALAERALRGGFHHLAMTYGQAVNYQPPDAMRQPLLEGMRQEFLDGQPYVASMLALKGAALGLSAIEARAFYDIAQDDEGPAGNELRRMALPGMPFAQLNDEELGQAKALAEQLKQQRKKAPKRYDS